MGLWQAITEFFQSKCAKCGSKDLDTKVESSSYIHETNFPPGCAGPDEEITTTKTTVYCKNCGYVNSESESETKSYI
jgi:predicted nucleic-acid-binding Zn-ribbon protein